ncbi:MAG: transcriptional regulator NrdR [Lentisphaeria bacterium]|nr:transcriptional regulator NrdR [Lentisphaeria bacterium]
MKCPNCQSLESKVIDSRNSKSGANIRRRRQCQKCQHRFTTLEELIPSEMFIIKSDDSREEYNPQKIRDGIHKACYKLKVREEQVDELLHKITLRVEHLGKPEISSTEVGTIVMEELKNFNHIAYVRFASVYRQFRDLDQFLNAIRNLEKNPIQ